MYVHSRREERSFCYGSLIFRKNVEARLSVSMFVTKLEVGLWLWMLVWKLEDRGLKLGGAIGSSSLGADLLIGLNDWRRRSTADVTSFDTDSLYTNFDGTTSPPSPGERGAAWVSCPRTRTTNTMYIFSLDKPSPLM